MLIFPAIDLFEGKAVRLLKGDYAQMTVYSERPIDVALNFAEAGAEWIHTVDLEGAKSGLTPNIDTILAIKRESGLKCEVGGGVRSMDTIKRYIDSGIDRVILGTAAVGGDLVPRAVSEYGEKIAVGVDARDGAVAVKGWTESSGIAALDFCRRMRDAGVKTLICTDISRDGAMRGTNVDFYRDIQAIGGVNVIASGGVSSLDDVKKLSELRLYGAIIGKAYYTGAIDLREAIAAGKVPV